MAAVVPHHPFWCSGGAGGVEDVQGIRGLDVDGCGRHRGAHLGVPVQPSRVVRHGGGEAIAGLDQDGHIFGAGQGEGFADSGQVLDPARGLDAAGGRDHCRGRGVADAGCQLPGGEATEDDGVHSSQPGSRQHGDRGFGDHRHVDDHAVAGTYAVAAQHTGEPGHEIRQFRIGVTPLDAQHGGVIDQGLLVPAASLHISVQGVIGSVEDAVGKPSVQRCTAGVDGVVRRGRPGNVRGGIQPEFRRLFQAVRVAVPVIAHDHEFHPVDDVMRLMLAGLG